MTPYEKQKLEIEVETAARAFCEFMLYNPAEIITVNKYSDETERESRERLGDNPKREGEISPGVMDLVYRVPATVEIPRWRLYRRQAEEQIFWKIITGIRNNSIAGIFHTPV